MTYKTYKTYMTYMTYMTYKTYMSYTTYKTYKPYQTYCLLSLNPKIGNSLIKTLIYELKNFRSLFIAKNYSAAFSAGVSSLRALRGALPSFCSAAAFSSAFSTLRSSRPSAIAPQQAERITSIESFASSLAGMM